MHQESPHTTGTREAAHELHELGYHLVPCEYGTKRPLIKWKNADCSHRLIDEWFDRHGEGLNIAIHAGRSGVIVLDADTTKAIEWIERHCPPTPMAATTPRGGRHAYYRTSEVTARSSQNLFGLGLDVRSGNAIVLASPSWSAKSNRYWQWRGEIVRPEILPILDVALVTRPASPPSSNGQAWIINPLPSFRLPSGPIRDVTRWIMAVDSIQGQSGSNQCFKVACRLVDAGFSWDEAWSWLCLWNGRKADPPWSEAELWHKLRDAFSRN